MVRYQKRAHNPLLIAAGFDTTDVAISWLGGSGCTWCSDSTVSVV